MTDHKHNQYPGIFLSTTDAALPEWFSNDYQKYANFHPMQQGGKGLLLACEDLNLGRTVAIKTLPPGEDSSPREIRRLLREARITAQLAHPNTIPVYEIGKTCEGQIYFAMKRIQGENLFEVLVRIARGDEPTKEKYPLDRLLDILQQVCQALFYAHNHGVIHRDIKPENILVGIFGEVYLMDWGVAKVWGMPNDGQDGLQENAEDPAHITLTGQRPGTPLYMSPEQVRGTPPVDERSDIFSIGVVLYEILAQREPFRGPTLNDTFAHILNTMPEPPSRVRPEHGIAKELDAICMKALAKRPQDRYSNVQQIIDEIEHFRCRQAFGAKGPPN